MTNSIVAAIALILLIIATGLFIVRRATSPTLLHGFITRDAGELDTTIHIGSLDRLKLKAGDFGIIESELVRFQALNIYPGIIVQRGMQGTRSVLHKYGSHIVFGSQEQILGR